MKLVHLLITYSIIYQSCAKTKNPDSIVKFTHSELAENWNMAVENYFINFCPDSISSKDYNFIQRRLNFTEQYEIHAGIIKIFDSLNLLSSINDLKVIESINKYSHYQIRVYGNNTNIIIFWQNGKFNTAFPQLGIESFDGFSYYGCDSFRFINPIGVGVYGVFNNSIDKFFTPVRMSLY